MYLVTKGTKARSKSATTDSHFTLLEFTAATGEPIMCAIILAAEKIEAWWEMGYDEFAE